MHLLHYSLPKIGPTDRAFVRVIERKPVTWSRKELGSKAPASFHTTDQKVRGSNPFGRTIQATLTQVNDLSVRPPTVCSSTKDLTKERFNRPLFAESGLRFKARRVSADS